MASTLDSISEVLRDIAGRLTRLEDRGQRPQGPLCPTWNDQGWLNTRRPPTQPGSVPMTGSRHPEQAPPITRQSYAGVSSRPGGYPSTGRDNSTLSSRMHPPTNNRRPPSVSVLNLDFWFLVNTIFDLVRLEHHRRIWLRFPGKLRWTLGEFIGMISPPLPNKQWADSMNALERDIEKTVVQRTRDHIETQKCTLKTALNNSNPDGLESAAHLAHQRLEARYGNKIRSRYMDEYFEEVLSYVGTSRSNVETIPTNQVGSINPTRPAVPPTTTRPASVAPMATTPQGSETNLKRLLTVSPSSDGSCGDEDDDFVTVTSKRTKKQTKRSRITGSGRSPVNQVGSETEIRNSRSAHVIPEMTEREISTYRISSGDEMEETMMPSTLNQVTSIIDGDSQPQQNTVPSKNTPLPSKRTSKNADMRSYLSSSAPQPRVSDQETAEAALSQPGSSTAAMGRSDRSESGGEANVTRMTVEDGTVMVSKHSGKDKTKWRVSPKPSAKVLVLGDSNMNLCRNLEDDFEVHAFSGARLANINVLLSQTDLDKTAVTDVVVAVGINNRDKPFRSSTIYDLRQTVSMAEKMKATVHFLGVSTPEDGTSDNIVQLNKHAEEWFGARYIEPILPHQVHISPTDTKYGIHHEEGTVERIFNEIITHIEMFRLNEPQMTSRGPR